MKILIAADMEGVTGVVSWDHVDPKHPEYARFRRLMTGDVNAAIRGAFDAGADEAAVADGHNDGRNILIEQLDERARLITGGGARLSMVEGADGADAALFVGYHARGGTPYAILDHTWSDTRVANVWLNGQLTGETGLNAAVCGYFGAPVLMVSGDQSVCAEAVALLGPIETAVVKHAHARFSADCLPPAKTQGLLYEAARRAVGRLRDGERFRPYQPAQPITIEVEFNQSDMADRASLCPGTARGEGKRVRISAADMPAAYLAFRTLLMLART